MTTMSGPPASRLDPEPVPRRDVLGLVALWAMVSTFLVALGGIVRLPKAAVLPSPSKKFRASIPETLAAAEPFVPPGRSVALFRDAGGVYAVSLVCTHLGCIVTPSTDGFECPCHGSIFALDGSVKGGPAPRALSWLKVSKRDDAFVVDEATTVAAGTKVSP